MQFVVVEDADGNQVRDVLRAVESLQHPAWYAVRREQRAVGGDRPARPVARAQRRTYQRARPREFVVGIQAVGGSVEPLGGAVVLEIPAVRLDEQCTTSDERQQT